MKPQDSPYWVPPQQRWAWILRHWPKLEWPRINPHRGFFVRIFLIWSKRHTTVGFWLHYVITILSLLAFWLGFNQDLLFIISIFLVPIFADELFRLIRKKPHLEVTVTPNPLRVPEQASQIIGLHFRIPVLNMRIALGFKAHNGWGFHTFQNSGYKPTFFPLHLKTHHRKFLRSEIHIDCPQEGLIWKTEQIDLEAHEERLCAVGFFAKTPGHFAIQGAWLSRILDCGLAIKHQYYPLKTFIEVIPSHPQIKDPHNLLAFEQSHSTSEELFGIRDFQIGDRLRQVDMRSWARTQKLQTREYSQTRDEPLRILLKIDQLSFKNRYLREGQIRFAASLLSFWKENADLLPTPWPKNWEWPADSWSRLVRIPVGFTQWLKPQDRHLHQNQSESDWFIEAGLDQSPYLGKGFRIVPGKGAIRWENTLCIIPIRNLEEPCLTL